MEMVVLRLNIKFIPVNDRLMFFVARIGNLNWMDFPFNVHLCKYLNCIDDENLNPDLTIELVDTVSGKLIKRKTVVLPGNYTALIYTLVLRQSSTRFDEEIYDALIDQTYEAVSLDRMVALATAFVNENV